MDKEEIIRRLKKISRHAVHVVGEPPFIMSLDDGIALDEAVQLLKEQEADKWIPVTERLPEIRHAVLCYSPHHKNIWALTLHEDNEWYYWIPMYQKYNPDFEGPITHWRPFPEQPKEELKDGKA